MFDARRASGQPELALVVSDWATLEQLQRDIFLSSYLLEFVLHGRYNTPIISIVIGWSPNDWSDRSGVFTHSSDQF